jgi:hypothetical protein
MAEKDGASTVRALVRGTRTALYVQLLVAVLALGATIWAIMALPPTLQKLQQARAETEQLGKEKSALTRANADLRAERDGLERAMPYLKTAHRAWARNSLEQALAAFNDALGEAPNDPDTLSSMAQVQAALGRFGDAAATMRLAIDKAGADSAFVDYARQATYSCRAGGAAQGQAALQSAPQGFASALNGADLAAARAELVAACGAAVLGSAQPQAPMAGEPPPLADRPPPPPSSSESAANSRRIGLGTRAVRDALDPYKIKIVYLHIRDESDRADAERVAGALRAANYRVPGIELVAAPRGYGASVRYYYAAQATEAHTIAGQVSAAVRDLNITGWTGWTPRETPLGGYERLPRDRLEVWLPPRAAAPPAQP